MAQHNEIEFEKEICEHLVANGWLYSPNDTGYDRERALFPADVLGWLAETQPEQLAELVHKEPVSPDALSLARELTAYAIAQGGRDNITVVILDLSNAQIPENTVPNT